MRKSLMASGAAALLALVATAPARADAVVYPSGNTPYGNTNVLNSQWWQWALSIPVDQSPFFDPTGANAYVNNNGPVFFLSGIFGVTEPGFPGTVGSAHRSITVPANTPLFFPVINNELDNIYSGDPKGQFLPLLSEAGIRSLLTSFVGMYQNLHASIDGVSVPLGGPDYTMSPYRDVSPAPFDLTFPDNNLYQFFYGPLGATVPAGTYPADALAYPYGGGPTDTVPGGARNSPLGDGIYLLVGPLSPGLHSISFGGVVVDANGPGQDFVLDITYDITVIPEPATLVLWGAGFLGLAGWRRWKRATAMA